MTANAPRLILEAIYAAAVLGLAYRAWAAHHGVDLAPDLLAWHSLAVLTVMAGITASTLTIAREKGENLIQVYGESPSILQRLAGKFDEIAAGRDPETMSHVLFAGLSVMSGFLFLPIAMLAARLHLRAQSGAIAARVRARIANGQPR